MTHTTAGTQLPWAASHPFITFSYRFDRLMPQTWALLGESSSKIEHIANVPMRPETAQQLFQIFLVKGVHGTTAIEGNTLSEEQVAKRIEGRLHLPPSQEYLGNEVDNIVKAYLWLINQIKEGAPEHVSPTDLKVLNKMVLEGLEVSDDVVPGEFRDHIVGVNDYRSPSHQYNQELCERLCAWMNEPEWDQVVGAKFVLPILKAIMSHLYLAWIHPFGDGNGRTARLLEFDILTRAGVPPISAHLLSDHYNKTRAAYYRALSAARRDPCEFIKYAVEGFADGLREQIDRVWVQQTHVTWINFVHGVYRKLARSATNDRRRDVAIMLGKVAEPVIWKDVPTLSNGLSAAYANSQRMLQRDLNALLDQELIGADEGMTRVWANLSLLQTFLPVRNVKRKPRAASC